MTDNTDDLRIQAITPLTPPDAVMAAHPAGDAVRDVVTASRGTVHSILAREDDRLMVVIGPCSIHDTTAAMEYAARLAHQRTRLGDHLEIIMRVYFEKPRTTVGWKGLINDPYLDNSFAINHGLGLARQLLCDVNALGLPAATEFLDVITPQYIADLVSWGAIGARTTESQIHREMASGLSCPVGFKNGTDGNLKIAVDAITAARQPHHFLAVTKEGRSAIATTSGNRDAHIVLRGGHAPNYDANGVAAAAQALEQAKLPPVMVVDASHANSGKNPDNQPKVIETIAGQMEHGERRIIGVMLESHLIGGRQDLVPGQPLTYGQSITDGCIGWDQSVAVLERLAKAVQVRRKTGATA